MTLVNATAVDGRTLQAESIMSRKPRIASRHYHAIDLIRIIAAVLVLLNHFADYSNFRASILSNDEPAFAFLRPFFGVGAVGVEVFFVISGLVIAASASKGTGLQASTRFLFLRAVRIAPALWISGLIALAARLSVGEPALPLVGDLLRSSFLSPAGPYIDGVVWSLVVEAFFYALVAGVVLASVERGLLKLALAIGSISVLFNFALVGSALTLPADVFAPIRAVADRFPFKVLLFQHGVFFAFGILIWAASVGRLPRSYAPFALICALGCVAELAVLTNLAPAAILVKILIWSAAVVLIAASAFGRLPSAEAVGQPIRRFARFLGELSYPLYLNHYVLGMVLTYHLRSVGTPALRLAIALAAVVLASIVVMQLERRVRQSITGRKTFERSEVPALVKGD